MVRIIGLIVFSYALLFGYGLITSGQTLGKRWLGVAITGVDGAPLPIWRHLVRILGVILITVPVVLTVGAWGLVLFAIDAAFIFGKRERCVHDLLAGSQIIRLERSG